MLKSDYLHLLYFLLLFSGDCLPPPFTFLEANHPNFLYTFFLSIVTTQQLKCIAWTAADCVSISLSLRCLHARGCPYVCVCVCVFFYSFFFRIICGIKLLLCWSTWTSLAMPEGQHEAQDDTTHRVLASTALAFISATLSSSSSSAFSAHQDHYSCSWCSSLSFSGMIVVVYLGTQTSEITQTHTHTHAHTCIH